ncbi:hypothetical protein [Gilvimarinus polysaccharolyticus]|uniref:hypothetical protein n=1 Tax=Gilvimarinus polysaccharolyticus TaxID=863921 RepID=UPI000673A5CB|nr:hypothetical protein [Gilvimarinus polysaccharolyticus]
MTDVQQTSQSPSKKRGQLQALLLMLIVALPMIAAYTIYHTGWGMPDGTVNQGVLLSPPIQISDLAPQEQNETWDLTEESKRWRYVIPGNASCDKTCLDNLYLTRQVHIRLNEKAERVERIYLLQDEVLSPELTQHIKEQHPLLRVMTIKRSDLTEALKGSNFSDDPVAAGRYFLMDQEGFLMLAYTPVHSGGELLKDIKKMLKNSYE